MPRLFLNGANSDFQSHSGGRAGNSGAGAGGAAGHADQGGSNGGGPSSNDGQQGGLAAGGDNLDSGPDHRAGDLQDCQNAGGVSGGHGGQDDGDMQDGRNDNDAVGGGSAVNGQQGGDGQQGPGGDDPFGDESGKAHVISGPAPKTAAGLESVKGFDQGQDHFVFGDLVGTATNFTTAVSTDYAHALSLANGVIAAGLFDLVAVQVGHDVLVFADSHHDNATADAAVRIVGRTLADVSFADFH